MSPRRLTSGFLNVAVQSALGRKIHAAKRDRAIAARLAMLTPGKVAKAAMLDRVALFTITINRLACTAAKNW